MSSLVSSRAHSCHNLWLQPFTFDYCLPGRLKYIVHGAIYERELFVTLLPLETILTRTDGIFCASMTWLDDGNRNTTLFLSNEIRIPMQEERAYAYSFVSHVVRSSSSKMTQCRSKAASESRSQIPFSYNQTINTHLDFRESSGGLCRVNR